MGQAQVQQARIVGLVVEPNRCYNRERVEGSRRKESEDSRALLGYGERKFFRVLVYGRRMARWETCHGVVSIAASNSQKKKYKINK